MYSCCPQLHVHILAHSDAVIASCCSLARPSQLWYRRSIDGAQHLAQQCALPAGHRPLQCLSGGCTGARGGGGKDSSGHSTLVVAATSALAAACMPCWHLVCITLGCGRLAAARACLLQILSSCRPLERWLPGAGPSPVSPLPPSSWGVPLDAHQQLVLFQHHPPTWNAAARLVHARAQAPHPA